MSTESRSISLLITVVLRVLLIYRRSSDRPDVIVFTFQRSILNAVFFFFDSSLFCLVQCLQSRFRILVSLSPTHPVKHSDFGGAALYCLGAAQLEAGGSCPAKRVDLRPSKASPWLITGRLLLPVFCYRGESTLRCPHQGAGPARFL